MTAPLVERDGGPGWALPRAQWKRVALNAWQEGDEDHIGLIAAGVAFYAFLALVPLLGAIVLGYGLLAAPATVIRDMERLTSVMPPDAAHLIGQQLMAVVKTSAGRKGLGVASALALALFGARQGASAVMTALNVAYEVTETRGFFAVNGVALAMTGTAVLVAILVLVAVAVLGHIEAMLPGAGVVLVVGQVLAYVALALIGAAVAATLYRFAPSHREARWVWVSPGSVLTTLCWLLLTLGFGLYTSKVGHYNATYGSLGAVIGLLTWFYLSSYALLFGAELNSELGKLTPGAAPAPPVAKVVPQAPVVPATRRPVSDLVDSLPLGLAASGLGLIRRRQGAGQGMGLMVLAAVLTWLGGFWKRRRTPV